VVGKPQFKQNKQGRSGRQKQGANLGQKEAREEKERIRAYPHGREVAQSPLPRFRQELAPPSRVQSIEPLAASYPFAACAPRPGESAPMVECLPLGSHSWTEAPAR
jgi:hypothetical protein